MNTGTSSSQHAAQKTSSAGSSSGAPPTLEPISGPQQPSSRTARRSSATAPLGDCSGTVAKTAKRSGAWAAAADSASFPARQIAAPSSGSARYAKENGGKQTI